MSIKQEQAERTRQELLDAALVVFGKKGYSQTRLEDIARQANVTRGAFYWHFKNKSDVFIELHKSVVDNFVEGMISTFDSNLSPIRNLEEIMYRSISKIRQHESNECYGKLFFRDEHAPELMDRIKGLKKKSEQKVCTFFSDIIDQGKDRAEIRTDISTQQIYFSAIITMTGAILKVLNKITPTSDADLKAMVTIYIDGIKKNER